MPWEVAKHSRSDLPIDTCNVWDLIYVKQFLIKTISKKRAHSKQFKITNTPGLWFVEGGGGSACADSLAMTGERRADSADAGSGVPRSAGPVQLALFSTFCRWIVDRCAHFVSLFSDQSICNSPSLSCHLHHHWTHLCRPMNSFQRNCVLLRYIYVRTSIE